MPPSRTPLVGDGFEFRHVLHLVKRLGPSDITVLITGETGTGKERVAHLLHENSPRARAPFGVLDAGAQNDNLLESALFGHEKGAFTGATELRRGLLEEVDGGTVFLDEVGELSPAAQTRLLRILEERTLRRVGGSKDIEVDVRIVAATNRDLEAAVARGEFRKDLLFRLKASSIHLPPLRKRLADLPALIAAILARWCRKERREKDGFSADALTAMLAYDWPGNIRELQDKIRNAVLLADGNLITAADLALGPTVALPRPVSLTLILSELEARSIRDALRSSNGVVKEAARLLGIDRCCLNRRLKEYAIDARVYRIGEVPPDEA